MRIFWKSVETIHVSLIYDKINGFFTWTAIYIFITSCSVLLRMRNVANKNKTQILCPKPFFSKIYAVLWIWKCTLQPQRPQITLWCAPHAGYQMLQTHTNYTKCFLLFHCNKHCTHAWMLYYTHIAYLLFFGIHWFAWIILFFCNQIILVSHIFFC